jgi:thiamine biosynthesis lipoprotein
MKRVCIGLSMAMALTGCEHGARDAAVGLRVRGETMGTTYLVRLGQLTESATVSEVRSDADAVFAAVDAGMSTYRPDSEISRFNDSTRTDCVAVSEWTYAVVEEALRVARETDGAFDITVAPLVDLWGFGARTRRPSVPSESALRDTMHVVGTEFVEICTGRTAIRKTRPEVRIDLSGIAKGFAVDALARRLVERGIESFLVEIGGEVRVGGRNAAGKRWRVAVQTPSLESGRAEVVLALPDSAVATSGEYRSFFVDDGVRYSHVLDPRTGRPIVHELVSVTVADRSAMRADALATALLVLGPEDGLRWAEDRGIAALFVRRNADSFVDAATPAFEKLIVGEGGERL